MGRTQVSQRMHAMLNANPGSAMCVHQDKNGWWVASLAFNWRVQYMGKGNTIEYALMNLAKAVAGK